MRTVIKGECGHPMEVDTSDNYVTCPTCGLVTKVDAPPEPPEPTPVPKDPDWTLRSFVKDLRRETCYPTLRAVIRILFGLVYVLLALTGITAMFSLGMGREMSDGMVIASLAMITTLAVALHQALLILIDIADASVFSAMQSRFPKRESTLRR